VLWLLAPLWGDVVAEKHLPRANVAGAGAEAAVGGLGISGQRTHLARGGVPSGQPQRFLCQVNANRHLVGAGRFLNLKELL